MSSSCAKGRPPSTLRASRMHARLRGHRCLISSAQKARTIAHVRARPHFESPHDQRKCSRLTSLPLRFEIERAGVSHLLWAHELLSSGRLPHELIDAIESAAPWMDAVNHVDGWNHFDYFLGLRHAYETCTRNACPRGAALNIDDELRECVANTSKTWHSTRWDCRDVPPRADTESGQLSSAAAPWRARMERAAAEALGVPMIARGLARYARWDGVHPGQLGGNRPAADCFHSNFGRGAFDAELHELDAALAARFADAGGGQSDTAERRDDR